MGPYGITPQEAKVAALMALPHPKNIDELRITLGKIRYYGCFCPNFSAIARPMLDLLKKGAEYKWDPAVHGAAFDTVVREIAKPGRALKRFDPSKPIFIHTDFSNVGLGAVLSQHDELGQEAMVCCASRSLNKHERNYSSYKGECLAAVWACRLFQTYTQGLHFTLVTDHEPLKWLMASQTLEGAHARWACLLQEHDFDIMHRPGKQSANVDALSRFPQQNSALGKALFILRPLRIYSVSTQYLLSVYSACLSRNSYSGTSSTQGSKPGPNPDGLSSYWQA